MAFWASNRVLSINWTSLPARRCPRTNADCKNNITKLSTFFIRVSLIANCSSKSEIPRDNYIRTQPKKGLRQRSIQRIPRASRSIWDKSCWKKQNRQNKVRKVPKTRNPSASQDLHSHHGYLDQLLPSPLSYFKNWAYHINAFIVMFIVNQCSPTRVQDFTLTVH